MNKFIFLFLPCLIAFYGFGQTPDTLVFSDGALISVYSDSVLLDGSILHQGEDTIVNQGNIYLHGDWINNNTTQKVFTPGTSGWLHLSGSSQKISGSSVTLFNNLQLEGLGIKELNSIDAEIEDTLALGDREFSAGDNTVFVLNSGTGVVTRQNILTGGFISSTNDGGLSRQTQSAVPYLFPVGSSSGQLRYRPVEIIPSSASANTLKVRMANVDPTSESYSTSVKDSSLCIVNPGFYHRIYHAAGTDQVNIRFYFDAVADGNFQSIAHWQNFPRWENTGSPFFTAGSPFSTLEKALWNDFSLNPFALATNAPAAPSITASGPTAFCSGGSVSLLADSGYSTYLWSNGDSTQSTVVTTSGSYSVTVSNGSSCAAVSINPVSVTVNNTPIPQISSTGTFAFCLDDTLDAGNGYFSYDWSTGETTQSIVALNPGTYSVTVTDSNGCSGNSVVSITDLAPVITASGSTTFCKGENVMLDAGPGYLNYLWSNGETSQVITVDSGGLFSVTVTDTSGCTAVSQNGQTVTVFQTPNIFASPDDTILFGSSDTIFAFGGLNYTWQPGGFSGNSIVVSPQSETLYTVTGTDSNGCADTGIVKVYVDTRCLVALPNIFSPNGDGKNEEFTILGQGFELLNLAIYDRWGKKVLETGELNKSWNGQMGNTGDLLNTGVYVYTLGYKCLLTGEEFQRHGNVTLTR